MTGPKFVLPPEVAERAIELGWLRAEDVVVSPPLPAREPAPIGELFPGVVEVLAETTATQRVNARRAGMQAAEVIAGVLAEWLRTGYLPPRCEPHPVTGAVCRRRDCDGQHDPDGLDPWTEENR